jgi:hypothetical protein
MAPLPSSPYNSSENWRDLYREAILELDQSKIRQNIVDAEKAIVERARELFQRDGDNSDEKQALDDAMYFLHALRSTLTFGTTATSYQGEKEKGMKVA